MTDETRRAHYSRKGAMRTIHALIVLGGSGTTRQIADRTESLAVHTDIDSVRCLLMDHLGITREESHDLVRREHGGTSNGRRVYRYRIDDRVVALYRRLAAEGFPKRKRTATNGARSKEPSGTAASRPTEPMGTTAPHVAEQTSMFDNDDSLWKGRP